MIKQIVAIKNFGIFKNFKWPSHDLCFLHTNIFYGANGSGKTTFSNFLSVLSSQISEDEKNDILLNIKNGDLKFEYEIINNENKKIKTTQKIIVFNSHFVSNHVFEGNVSKFKEFKEGVITEESLQNPKIKKILNEILKEEKRLEKINKRINSIEEIANRISVELSSRFNKEINGKRLNKENILNYKDKKESDYNDGLIVLDNKINEEIRKYKMSQDNYKLLNDIELLRESNFKNIIFKKSLENFLKIKISSNTLNKIKTKINEIKSVPLERCSHQDWFETGFKILKFRKNKKTCPLCDTKVNNIDTILKEYSYFFSEEFKKFQQDAVYLKDNLFETKRIIEKNLESINNIKKIIADYSFQDLEYDVIDTVDHEFKYFLDNIEELSVAVEEKTKDVDREMTEIDYEEIGRFNFNKNKHNTVIVEYREIKDLVLEKLEKNNFNEKYIRGLFRKYFWEKLFIEVESEFKEFIEKSKDKLSGLSFIKNSYKKQREIENILQELETKKEIELAKLKKESKFVNGYLKKLNINHFEIQINNENTLENIKIIFTKIKEKKDGIKYTLSDGEKTALSFAYFLSKIKYEIVDNKMDNLNEYIVIIDDPISSLDENRLFSTALLIKEIFSRDCQQLFILSHNLIFLKFVGNIIDKKNKDRNDFLIEDGKILPLPNLLKNYQTSYFYKIEKICNFVDGGLKYDIAKEFIPNYIRIVLEAFLSFKLCRLSSKNNFQSAGMKDLISSLSGSSFADFKENDLVNKDNLLDVLWSIKNKVDPESHGSIQDITDIEYISKKELKKIAEQSLHVIEFLDQLHIEKINNKIQDSVPKNNL